MKTLFPNYCTIFTIICALEIVYYTVEIPLCNGSSVQLGLFLIPHLLNSRGQFKIGHGGRIYTTDTDKCYRPSPLPESRLHTAPNYALHFLFYVVINHMLSEYPWVCCALPSAVRGKRRLYLSIYSPSLFSLLPLFSSFLKACIHLEAPVIRFVFFFFFYFHFLGLFSSAFHFSFQFPSASCCYVL